MVDPRHDLHQLQLAAVILQHLEQRLHETRAFEGVPPGVVAWWEIMYDTFNAEFIVFNIYPQLIPSPHDPIHNRALMMISLTSPNSANACYGVLQMPRTAALRVASGEISQLSCGIFTEARPLFVCPPRSSEYTKFSEVRLDNKNGCVHKDINFLCICTTLYHLHRRIF